MYNESYICTRVKTLRKERGLTKTDLAKKMAISEYEIDSLRVQLSKWEAGERTPEISNLCRLCNALDCDIEYLLGAIGAPHRTTHDVMEQTGLNKEAVEQLQTMKTQAEAEVRYNYDGILAGNIHKQEVLNFLISRDNDFDLLRSLYSLLFSKGSTFAMDRQTEAGSKERLSRDIVAVCNDDPTIIETVIRGEDIQSVFMLTVQKNLLNMRDTIQNQNQPTNVKRKRSTSRQRD